MTDKKETPAQKFSEEEFISQEKQINFRSQVLRYQVTSGRIPLKNKEQEIEAQIFFTYYQKTPSNKKRPVTFAFNGGPGSPSIWLHLGALGPKRVKMTDEGFFPELPFELIDNDFTWLDETDLVFVDPVGCGYSQAKDSKTEEKFFNVAGDIESMGEFIRLFLIRFQRWGSPLFLAGESYGAFRVSGLAGDLFQKGITFNGVILISGALNFYTLHIGLGYRLHDLPYILILPSYTASAWHHRKLDESLLQRDLPDLLDEVEQWAKIEYAAALMEGSNLSEDKYNKIVDKLCLYTGLKSDVVRNVDLRILLQDFCYNLMKPEDKIVGRLDTRFVGLNAYENIAGTLTGDPSLASIIPPFSTCFYQYVAEELGYKSDLVYQNLTGVSSWKWETGHDDSSQALQKAMSLNPYMKLYLGVGYYDLATPYFAMDYTVSHMRLDKTRQQNITYHRYEAGHMYYINKKSLSDFYNHIVEFIQQAM
ncbi:S10 family peptidase [Candidatus Uabimicrobium sp. HlEnr_7]|uniref:S10 family peptidase n=1 Tax=Candidatus Uabimicrobium helgolandensis TaxID=3095367 RepID=UPI003556882B